MSHKGTIQPAKPAAPGPATVKVAFDPRAGAPAAYRPPVPNLFKNAPRSAPPAYRPVASLQSKPAGDAPVLSMPAQAPPVYRPNPSVQSKPNVKSGVTAPRPQTARLPANSFPAQGAAAMQAKPMHSTVIQPGRVKISNASLHRGYKSVTVASQTSFTGRWTPTISVRGSRSYKKQRNEQLLRHVSVQFFHFVRNSLGMGKEQEVQAMHINGRIVLSANDDASLQNLYKDLKGKAKEYVKAMESRRQAEEAAQTPNLDPATQDQIDQILKSPEPDSPLVQILTKPQSVDERTSSHAKKLTKVIEKSRKFSTDDLEIESIETLQNIADSEMFVSKMDMNNPADCKKKLSDLQYANRIIVLQNGGALHAEQKLVIALWRSAVGLRAIIYGKKRPCTGCYGVLTYAKEKLGLSISFNVRPGGYWSPANEGLKILADEANKSGKCTHQKSSEWYAEFTKSIQTHQTHSISKGVNRHKLKTFDQSFKANQQILNDTDYASDSDTDADV